MIWIIEESPNPGVWDVLQSRGMYKSESRAIKAAQELQRWHRENLTPDSKFFDRRYRAVAYVSLKEAQP
jgi:hypothetical protein